MKYLLLISIIESILRYKLVQCSYPNSTSTPTSQQLMLWAETNGKSSTLVTSFGTPVADPANILTAGVNGPVLLQDTYFLDEIQSFNRERIPERVVHAKGAGAYGYLEVTNDITNYTLAQVFGYVGARTSCLVRFSQVGGERGYPDTARDVRGFAMKFYTSEGIWDLVGNNIPVFFIRDPALFPDLIHSQKRNPASNLRDPNMYWDFTSLRPETTLAVLMVNSDGGIPKSYRYINGFGINAFRFVNATGNVVYAKFHLISNQGVKNLTSTQGTLLVGEDPDYYVRDLFNAIGEGNFPTWNFSVQIMTMEQASGFRWNPFDATKFWPVSQYPLIPVGKLVLTQNPTNFFANIEQVGFNPGHLVPGIEVSPDKLLQGRMFAYSDTQMYRLGPNGIHLQTNRPPFTVLNNYLRDGFDADGNNQKGAPNYYPNSYNGPKPSPRGRVSPYPVQGDIGRYDTSEEDNFSQATLYWTTMLTPGERQRVANNIAASLGQAYAPLQERSLQNFYQVSQELGNMLTKALRASKK